MPTDGYMDAAAVPVPDAGDDELREHLATTIERELRAHPTITATPSNPGVIGTFGGMSPHAMVDALLPLIREHIAAAVQAERVAERDVHTEYAARFSDGSIGVEQDTLESAKAYAQHRAKQNRVLDGTPLEDPSGPATGYVKRTVTTLYGEWEAATDG